MSHELQAQLDRIEAKLDQLLAPKKARTTKPVSVLDPAFLEFWKIYPVKKAKQSAYRAWKNRKADVNVILQDIQTRMKTDRQWIEGYIPHPATYLNGARWEDEITQVQAQSTIPKDNFDMLEWARDRGMRDPRPGEDWFNYRKYVQAKFNG